MRKKGNWNELANEKVVIPDVAESLVGYRAMRPEHDDRGLRLYAENQDYVWSPGVNEAWCMKGVRLTPVLKNRYDPETGEVSVEVVDVYERHDRIPAENCSCGFYVLSSTYSVIKQFRPNADRVYTKVKIWGKCVPYQDGYRAEKAEIQEFVRVEDDWWDCCTGDERKELLDRYGVEVVDGNNQLRLTKQQIEDEEDRAGAGLLGDGWTGKGSYRKLAKAFKKGDMTMTATGAEAYAQGMKAGATGHVHLDPGKITRL